MNNKIFLSTIFLTALIITGCSEAPKTSNSAQSNSANVNSSVNTVITANTNTNVNSQVAMQPARGIENVDANAFNSNSAANLPTIKRDKSEDVHKSNVYGRTAPDNSSFVTIMNEKGQAIEVRTFQNHPQLIKVERVFVTPKTPELKIYLKGGKVITASDDKLPNFSASSPEQILEVAGIKMIKQTAPAAETKKQ